MKRNGTYFFGNGLGDLGLDAFLPGLAKLADDLHPEIAVRWDQDVGQLFDERCHGMQVFTGAGPWNGFHTLCRVHALDKAELIYLTVAFAEDPAPHWYVAADGYNRQPYDNRQPYSYCMVRR